VQSVNFQQDRALAGAWTWVTGKMEVNCGNQAAAVIDFGVVSESAVPSGLVPSLLAYPGLTSGANECRRFATRALFRARFAVRYTKSCKILVKATAL
jgi:hypothetical protein